MKKQPNNWKEQGENYLLYLQNWENYCGACDNFGTEDCPKYGHVDEDTDWTVFNCKYFID